MSYEKQHPDSVRSLFSSIAPQYDKGNATLSFYLHTLWNRSLVHHCPPPQTPYKLLDLCAGTGAIAFTYLKKYPNAKEAILLDFCQEMLDVAEKKAKPKNLFQYVQANAEEIPLPSNEFDVVTLAYGIRNIPSPQKAFAEAFRVLKPGGTFGILELTRPSNKLLRLGHKFYLNTMVPLLGKWVASNKEAYDYLSSTIQTFTAPKELSLLLQKEQFAPPVIRPLFGGIATLILAKKL